MTRTLCVFLLAVATLYAADERRQSFNDGWTFAMGDVADAPGVSVRLPHDWAIDGPFDKKWNPSTGGLPISGTAWYRKSFTVPASSKGKNISIEFDGVMSNARVFLNGKELGARPYGYIGFSFDLTPGLKMDGDNVITVRVSPEDRSSRWYPGAGIYRNVWLDTTGPVYVARWGTTVTTKDNVVTVKTDVAGSPSATVETTILDAAGKQVGRATGLTAAVTIPTPVHWDIDRPYLYTAVSEVLDGKRVLDRYETPFGFRTATFDKDKGFLLNGRVMKLHGVCLHHDLGALGAAVNKRAIERQLEILKAAGVNAIRTSHNPPSPEFLAATDRMGFVVIDEAFDMWRIPKVPNGYAKFFGEWSERDIRDMVRRDRNHPSVIMWSIGNEVGEQGRADGWQVAKRLVDLVRAEDTTRPTTAGFDNWQGAIKNKVAEQVDVPGFNYKPNHYEEILKDHPGWIIYASESSSTVSSRGVYHLPLDNYGKHESLQVTSYDVVAPYWATPPDVEFYYQDKLPNVAGEFVWTGFDYLGEPTPYNQFPSRSSYFGMVDLAGFPKDRYYLYQSVWTTKPMVHLLPHWNWEGKEGQSIPVMAYSNADEVELFVNGKSLGRKKTFTDTVEIPVGNNVSADKKFASKYRLMWQVPYAPGIVKAVAYRAGKQVAVDEVGTAGVAARVKLLADRAAITADGKDLSFVTVRVEDKDGNLVPGASNLLKFSVTGAGEIRAVDNGNAATDEPFHADHRKAFSGMALVIVGGNGKPGKIKLGATSEGLTGTEIELTTRPEPRL